MSHYGRCLSPRMTSIRSTSPGRRGSHRRQWFDGLLRTSTRRGGLLSAPFAWVKHCQVYGLVVPEREPESIGDRGMERRQHFLDLGLGNRVVEHDDPQTGANEVFDDLRV